MFHSCPSPTREVAMCISSLYRKPTFNMLQILYSYVMCELLWALQVSSDAHVQVMRVAKPGMREYELEATFLHHVYRYGGCRHCSYTCICATGSNSSILHYGHASAPNDRVLQDGDVALLDMGAEYHFYGSDITCSFPINGRFTESQKFVYNSVLDAQNAVIAAMRLGLRPLHLRLPWVILLASHGFVSLPPWYLTFSMTTSHLLKHLRAWRLVKHLIVPSIQLPESASLSSQLDLGLSA